MFEVLAAGATFGLSGGLSPGPLLALVVAETIARGRRAGLAVAASPLVTDGPIIAVAVLLLGRIEESESALGILNIAGGVLLASYGLTALQRVGEFAEAQEAPSRVWGSLGKGVAANLLNPNPYLFWLTIGAPLLVKARAISLIAAAGFLALFYLGLVGSKSVLAVLVARSRGVLRGRTYVWVNRILASVLLLYAVLFVRNGFALLD
jgi:threonine/homoserine/homoserine lactone efflux protein